MKAITTANWGMTNRMGSGRTIRDGLRLSAKYGRAGGGVSVFAVDSIFAIPAAESPTLPARNLRKFCIYPLGIVHERSYDGGLSFLAQMQISAKGGV